MSLCDDGGMKRNPLWIGELDIVRAVFGHAANADPDRLLRIVPPELTGRVVQAALEARIRNRRLDVLITLRSENAQASQRLVVEAKVGAVVDKATLTEYLAKVQAPGGRTAGLLVAPYQPVGQLPEGWSYRDLQDVADQLSCPPSGGALCGVRQEISYAVSSTVASDRVAEWRALTEATRHAAVPDGWETHGSGSSVGRPLVWFASPWLERGGERVRAGRGGKRLR